MGHLFRGLLLASALTGVLNSAAWAADAALLNSARNLISAGEAREAFNLLAQHEKAEAGTYDFDYLYGLSALEAGMPQLAIFALERALAVNPNSAEARVAIARTYFALGERKASEESFQQAKNAGLPPAIGSSVDRYLAALQGKQPKQSAFTGYVSATVGFDSNANAATDETQISIPLFAGLGLATLNADAREQDDGFLAIAGGVGMRHDLGDGHMLTGGINLRRQMFFDVSDLDTGVYDAALGYRYATQTDVFNLSVQGQLFTLDDDSYRNAYGLSASWERKTSEKATVGAFGQLLKLEYPDQHIRDATRYVLGLAGSYTLSGTIQQPKTRLVGRLYAGAEDEDKSNVAHLGHDLYGIGLSLTHALSADWTTRIAASYEKRDYGGTEPLFLVGRDDDQWQVAVSASYSLTPQLSVVPQLGYTRNDSNIVLNDYDRYTASVTVRYSFN